jgi:hypothetical protein
VDGQKTWDEKTQAGRWIAAAIWVLLTTVFIVFVAPSVGLPEVCDEKVVETEIKRVCSEPGMDRLGLLYLPALLLLLPDLSEFDVFGVAAKRIARQADRKASDAQNVAGQTQEGLEAVTLVAGDLSAQAAPAMAGAALARAARTENEAGDVDGGVDSAHREGGSGPPDESSGGELKHADSTRLADELFEIWEDELSALERIARRLEDPDGPQVRASLRGERTNTKRGVVDALAWAELPPLTDAQIDAIANWARTHTEDLAGVRVTAFAASHGHEIDPGVLANALLVARRLKADLPPDLQGLRVDRRRQRARRFPPGHQPQ